MNKLFEQLAEAMEDALQNAITDDAMKPIMKRVRDVQYDMESFVESHLKETLAPMLTNFVTEMADKAVTALLEGNQEQMRRYLECQDGYWTSRSDSPPVCRKYEMHEWHPVIHGKLHEQQGIALRHKVVDAHRDLITNERIKDLEDQNRSLVEQVNRAIAEKNAMYERFVGRKD